MKNWKQWTFVAVLALTGIIVAFSGCDNGNGDQILCECASGTVYYDEECPCDGNNCNCKSEYKPVFEDIFAFLSSVDNAPNVKIQSQNAYDAIWITNAQLIVKLKNAVVIHGSVINIVWADTDITNARIDFAANNGRIRVYGELADTDFNTAFEAAIEDCVSYYLQE